jgi:hypothetical protein
MEQQGNEPSGKSCAKQAAVKTVFTEDRSSYLDGVPPARFPAKCVGTKAILFSKRYIGRIRKTLQCFFEYTILPGWTIEEHEP